MLLIQDRRLVRVRVRSKHAPAGSAWAALPYEHRGMTTAVKQQILSQMTVKTAAKRTSLLLSDVARRNGAESSSRGACLDRGLAPERAKVRKFMDNAKVSGSSDGQFDTADKLLRGVILDNQQVIYYRTHQPGARHGTARALTQVRVRLAPLTVVL
jgi:hypothetical protein